MKLIQQVCLEYREGTSDKVYEVDLCETGPDRFVVNFRYGRRGSVLREGAKTPASVSESEARRIFDQLVASKENKGYRRRGTGTESVTADEAGPTDQPSAADPRAEAVLKRLTEGNRPDSRWSLSRAAWRAGELKLTAAEPVLAGLIGAGDAMLDYSIVWALAQCGTAASVDLLKRLEASHEAPAVRRIAGTALLQLLDGDEYDAVIRQCLLQLPDALRDLAEQGPADELTQAVSGYLARQGGDATVVLELLYLINTTSATAITATIAFK